MADEHPLELEEIKRREGMKEMLEVDARTADADDTRPENGEVRT
jgi:hypothetical protein